LRVKSQVANLEGFFNSESWVLAWQVLHLETTSHQIL
jgi:hypothetical protein